MTRRTRRAGFVTALVLTLVIALAATPAFAGRVDERVALPGSAAPYARISARVRDAAATERVDFQVFLGLRDRGGAAALLARVSNPRSPSFRHYLSPAAFRARFSRPDSDVRSVAAWLREQGFRVGTVPANHLYVPASGTVAQAERAFGVSFAYYRSGGQTLRSPSGAPSIPASMAGLVEGVLGLADSRVHPNIDAAPPPPVFRNAPPCSSFWAETMATEVPEAFGATQPYAPCGYTPSQLQGAYGTAEAIAGGNDGTGVTVAIIDAYLSPTLQEDLDTFSSLHGLSQTTLQIFSVPIHRGSVGNQQGWYGEQTLDVEAVHSMAPGASILYWGAASSGGADIRAAMIDIVDNDRAQLISNSYGNYGEQLPPKQIVADNDVFIQAGLEGIGVYFSSGDRGDEVVGLGYRSVDWSASSPYVTAVGGTSLAVGEADDYLFETGWGTTSSTLGRNGWAPAPPGDFLYGGGGGTSFLFPEPDYQQGVVPDSLSGFWGTGFDNRVVPDISTVGDPNTGMLIGETQSFPNGSIRYSEYRVGGTSLSCPLMAGIMALADQRAGVRHGFVNPELYELAGTTALRDIVDPATTLAVVRANYVNGVNPRAGIYYTLRALSQTGTLDTIPGYDDVTGLGSPNGEAFLAALG
jgi:subtilase family serine protease